MIGIGIWLGIIAAVHHNKLIDQVLRVFSIVGWSIPTFVFGLLVLMLFYARLGLVPARSGSPNGPCRSCSPTISRATPR